VDCARTETAGGGIKVAPNGRTEWQAVMEGNFRGSHWTHSNRVQGQVSIYLASTQAGTGGMIHGFDESTKALGSVNRSVDLIATN